MWLQLNSIYLSVDHSRLLFLMVSSVVRLVGTLLASRWLSTLVCSQGQDPFSHTSGHQVIFDEELQTFVVLLHLQTFLQNDHEVESTWHFYIFLMIFLSGTQLNFFWSVISQQSLLSLLMNPILASVDLVLFLASVGHITARFTKKEKNKKHVPFSTAISSE